LADSFVFKFKKKLIIKITTIRGRIVLKTGQRVGQIVFWIYIL